MSHVKSEVLFMKMMKPIRTEEIANGDKWIYEVKYDGFRSILHWEKGQVRLISKNQKDFTSRFSEIIAACLEKETEIERFLPIKLDGELVILNTAFQANFSLIQKRGRLKNKSAIDQAAHARPASFMAFDLLKINGEPIAQRKLTERKQQLHRIFQQWRDSQHVQSVNFYENKDELKDIVFSYKGEGIIAKRRDSLYIPGKNHHDWLKIKNWRNVQGFLTAFNTENQYFTIEVFK